MAAPKLDYTAEVPRLSVDELDNLYYSASTGGADPGIMRQLLYGFSSATTDVGNLAILLESYVPTGTFFNPTATYGEEFMAMSPEERRQFLLKRREDMLKQEYADIYAADKQDSLASNIGEFGGSLFSPTTLIPIGQSYKAVAASSALLGAEYDLLDQYVKKGEVDPIQTAQVSAGAGALGLGAIWAGRTYSKIKAKRNLNTPEDLATANNRMKKINEATASAVSIGLTKEELPRFIATQTGLRGEDIAEAIALSEIKPVFPTLNEIKFAEIAGINGFDTVSRINNGFISKYLTPVISRIEQLSPELAMRLRRLDLNTHVKTMERLEKSSKFVEILENMNPNDKQLAKKYLFNGDFEAVKPLFEKFDDGLKALDDVIGDNGVLNEMFRDLEGAGYKNLNKITNYMPRKILDMAGLKSTYNEVQLTKIQELTQKRANDLGIDVSDLSDIDKEKIIGNVLRGIPDEDAVRFGISNVKNRKIPSLSDSQLMYYADPSEALVDYIRYGTNSVEKRRFFGMQADEVGEILNSDKSVQKLVDNLDIPISTKDTDTLKNLLKVRFVTGEQGSSNFIQKLRTASYLSTLANPVSAVTQLGDIGMSAWINGVEDTFFSLFGKKRLTMQQLGLDDHLAQEFSNEQLMAKTLHKAFTLSGFRSIDKAGKNIFLESALKKAERMVFSKEGEKVFSKKYQKAFGDDYTALVEDLRAGRMTDNVKLYLWNELSGAQPISLSDMPEKYLNAPDGRIFYALKTFMLKQLDTMKKRTYDEFKKGNKGEAVRNAVSFMATVPVTNMAVETAKDLVTGKDTLANVAERYELDDPEKDEILNQYLLNTFKLVGASEYIVDKIRQGKWGQAAGAAAIVAPPLNIIDSTMTSLFKTLEEGEVDDTFVKELPLFGRIWYYWFGGGLEKINEKRLKKIVGEE